MKRMIFLAVFSLLFMSPLHGHGDKDEHAGMDHTAHGEAAKSKASEPSIKLSVPKVEDKDDKKVVQIKLTKTKDDSPVPLDNLKEVHTQKIHLLIIDDSLEDYSHIHPKPTKEAGVYEFEWSPTKKNANYRVWADLFPLDTNVQEYAIADLTTSQGSKAEINRTASMQSSVEGLTFKLTFDSPDLQAGKATMGKIVITDDKGNPVKSLEPIMGSFAHIVGFGDDLKSVVHIHPMGTEPTKDTDRGGPELQFHIEPEKAGFIKMFAQVKVNGKELFAPFGLVVNEPS
ncbi:MAG: hypothetical protein K2Y18_02075 [Alphaproteobacteria bacterium]|nr:hypothetical protein [Alphaproteobacteria bacterium]